MCGLRKTSSLIPFAYSGFESEVHGKAYSKVAYGWHFSTRFGP